MKGLSLVTENMTCEISEDEAEVVKSVGGERSIVCAKGLSALFHQETDNNRIQGVRVCLKAPKISHLLFTDDDYFFMRESIPEARNIHRVVDNYKAASG